MRCIIHTFALRAGSCGPSLTVGSSNGLLSLSLSLSLSLLLRIGIYRRSRSQSTSSPAEVHLTPTISQLPSAICTLSACLSSYEVLTCQLACFLLPFLLSVRRVHCCAVLCALWVSDGTMCDIWYDGTTV